MKNILISIAAGFILGIASWYALYMYHVRSYEVVEVVIEPMRPLPVDNKCLYIISSKPYSSYNGHLKEKCGVFSPYNKYEIIIKKPL